MKSLEEIKNFVISTLGYHIDKHINQERMPIDGFYVSSADIEDGYVYVTFREPFYCGGDARWVDEGSVVERCEENLRDFVSQLLLIKYNVVTVKSQWTSLTLALKPPTNPTTTST